MNRNDWPERNQGGPRPGREQGDDDVRPYPAGEHRAATLIFLSPRSTPTERGRGEHGSAPTPPGIARAVHHGVRP